MKNPNKKKLLLAMALYMASIMLMVKMRGDYAGTLWYWSLTILPLLPMAYAIRHVFITVLNMDEMMRRIHMEAIVFSAFVTGFITFSWDLMSNAGLPDFKAVWVMPMLMVGYTVGLIWRKRSYQ